MRNILLQHYKGPLSDLAKISVDRMKAYAEMCGAEYRLLTGDPFAASLKFQGKKAAANNKVAMLGPQFDDYDVVVMVDPDMIPVKGLTSNIFTEETGIGICPDHVINNAWARFQNRFPQYSTGRHAFWAGSVYRLEKSMRKRLRSHINYHEVKVIGDSIFVDEGIMHRLAMLADVEVSKDVILPQKWSYCSYLPEPLKNGAFIHMRKNPPDGKGGKNRDVKIEKIDSFNMMVEQGVIDP